MPIVDTFFLQGLNILCKISHIFVKYMPRIFFFFIPIHLLSIIGVNIFLGHTSSIILFTSWCQHKLK